MLGDNSLLGGSDEFDDVGKRPKKIQWTPKRIVLLFLLTAAIIGTTVGIIVSTKKSSSSSGDNEKEQWPEAVRHCNRQPALGRRGAVATTNFHATKAGMDVLEAGGTAFDAAAAVQFMLALVQPQSTGIGGGCFVIGYSSKDGSIFALDGREEAPAAFNETSFCANPDCWGNADCDCSDGAIAPRNRTTGGLPVGVPGVVAAMDRLMKLYGTKSLAEVMAPAIAMARNGFPMYEELRKQLLLNKDRLTLFEASRKLYYTNNGNPLEVGQIFKNLDLANTYDHIAKEGIDAFYKGKIAEDIVATVHAAVNPYTGRHGVMTMEDLAGYRAVFRKPVRSNYRDNLLVGMNMPSSGGTSLMQMANILAHWELSQMKPAKAELLHKLIDAQDIAWADRARYMGDADFVDVPIDGLLDQEYARQRAANFTYGLRAARSMFPDTGVVPSGVPPGAENINYGMSLENDRHGTTHLSIADQWGNVVSMTTTIEENLGSGVVVPGRGFLLNNELTDFDGVPADASGRKFANRPEGGKKLRRTALGDDATTMGGKRPLSSMSPTIAFRKDKQGAWRPHLAIGTPGGARIIGQVLNALVYTLDNGLCTTDAIDQPRIISRNQAAEVEMPLWKDRETVDTLSARGFEVQELITARPLGYVQSVRLHYDNGVNESPARSETAEDARLFQLEDGVSPFIAVEAGADEVRMTSAKASAF